MEKKIRIGIIGAGRIGRIHARSILYHIPGAEVAAVADANPGAAQAWAASLGLPPVLGDYRDILNDDTIDAVLVCSSTDTHSAISTEAAIAGKHIFCEKPVDFDLGRIASTLDAVRQAGVKFQVGFNRRFDHNFQAVHQAVRDGRVGEPHIIRITSRDPEPPPVSYVNVSGGMFLDMTIHDFDMARFLSGSEVEEVYAAGAVLVDKAIGEAGDIDTAVITLKFANGAIGVIDNSRKAAYGYDQRVEVFGSQGSVSVTNDAPSTAVVSTSAGVVSEKPKYFFLERYMDSFVTEMQAFVTAIAENKDVPVNGHDGLMPVKIGLAAQKSLREGRPVRLSEM